MPLQFPEFTDLQLLFIILEPCHYNFTNLRTIPLHTLSLCFLNFMDKNTPDLLLPLTPPSFLSLYGKSPPRRTPRRSATWAHPPRAPPAASARSPAAWAWPPRARRLPSQQPMERERRGAGGRRSEEEEEGLLRRCEARRCPGWISPSRHGRPPGRREGEGT